MRCERFGDASAFLEAIAPLTSVDQTANTVLVGAALARREQPVDDGILLVASDDGRACLAALLTPPFPLALSSGDPNAVPAIGEALIAAAIEPPGVGAPGEMADSFAGWWTERRGSMASLRHALILYRATEVSPPAGVRGRLRQAAESDVDLLTAWSIAFVEQTGVTRPQRDMRAATLRQVGEGRLFCWEVDGRPVSMAGFVPTTAASDSGRINMVLTPEDQRGRAYASALVAALSARLLDRGWRHCLIFADAANPITNRIYPRIGYRPAGTYRELTFQHV